MPTYAFQCPDCELSVEAQLGFDDPQPTTCTNCGGALKRLYGNLGVTFRGSGFYRTDSRASNAESSKPSAAPTASKAESSKGSSN